MYITLQLSCPAVIAFDNVKVWAIWQNEQDFGSFNFEKV